MKKTVLTTGMSGLVGTRIRELLDGDFEFIDLSLDTGVDITDNFSVTNFINDVKPEAILHMAAKTDVDGCEDEKILGEDSPAWQVNVVGTQNIARAARKHKSYVIYISTDFVFDGTKEYYTEKDDPNPINWYAITKHEGEKVIAGSDIKHAIARIAYPYRAYFPAKKDFVRRILEVISSGNTVYGLTDHIFTPTFIDDLAGNLRIILENEPEGIFHLVGSQSLSVIEAVKLIADTFALKADIKPVTRDVFFRNRAFRPFNLSLKNDKISKFGIGFRTFEKGLREMKEQMP